MILLGNTQMPMTKGRPTPLSAEEGRGTLGGPWARPGRRRAGRGEARRVVWAQGSGGMAVDTRPAAGLR